MNDKTDIDPLQILLVEDNPTDALLLEEALEHVRGVKIKLTHVKRLDEALSRLQVETFDAVLLDLGLPDSSGLETFTRTQDHYPALPILVLSGLDDETLAVTAVRNGAQEYLIKGKLDSVTLARSIRYAIERKRSAEKLASSEMGYRRLFETAKDGIFILDAVTGQITDANPYLEEMLGYTTTEFIGKRLWEVGAFRDKAASKAAFATLQETGYIRYDDLPLTTKDGRQVSVEFVSNIYAVGDKQVIQCNIRDITERNRAEMARQESERFLQSTIDALSSHIAVLDESGRIIAVNKVWQQFAEENGGTAISCGVGANYIEVCNEARGEWSAEAPRMAQGIREVMAGTHKVFCLEYPCHSPSEKRWFSVCVTRFAGDGPVHVAIAHENITERKRAEEELRESEERKSAILETALDCIIGIDAQSRILEWNPASEKTFGYRREEAMGELMPKLIIPEALHQAHFAGMEKCLATGEGPLLGRRIEISAKRKNGEEFPVELAITRMESQGNPVFIAYLRDITASKRAEAQIHFQKTLLEAQLETSPHGILVVADEGEILSYNQHFLEMWGIPQQVVEEREDAKALQSVLDKLAYPQQFLEKVAYLYRHREEQSNEEILLRDGRVFNRFSSPISSADGLYYGRVWYFNDISASKQAEQELQDSKVRFENIVANVPGVVYQYILHPDGSAEIPFVNEACRELFGMESEEIQGSPNLPSSLIHPDDRAESERSIAESAAKLSPWHWEGRFQLPTGEIKWIQAASHPRRLPDGATLWDGLLLDITARKEAEEERDRFFTMSLDMLCIADHNGYFKRLNPAFEKTLGFSNAELMAKPFLEWVHPDDINATLAVMQDLNAGASIVNFANRYRCRDGSYRWISWVSAPYEDLIYAAAHDVTSLKNAEAALHKANDELELNVIERTAELSRANEQLHVEMIERKMAMDALREVYEVVNRTKEEAELAREEADAANHAKSEFLSRMSHELRTPLNAVLGFGQILEMSRQLDDGDIEAVGHILKGGRHLLGLINEVLDIASIEAGRISLSPEPILLSQTIREVLDMVRPLAATRHIRLVNEVAEHDDRHVRADEQRFRQVLLNLLANAIKYNCDGGRVTVSCAASGRFLRLGVSDTGSGLTTEEVGKLFVPFERLGAAKLQVEGTGLGLVLCKTLVEAMEGRIGVDSVPGQGSTFWVEFPLAESQSAQVQTQLARSEGQIGSLGGSDASLPQAVQRTVLYIEDNLSNFKVIEHLLADRPHIKLLSAMQGSIGLDLACQHLPDLILLDLHLPDIPGDVVLRRLRAEPATRDIPVVVLSADATPTQIEKLRAAGIEHYLTKPLDLRQFLLVLDEILNKKDI